MRIQDYIADTARDAARMAFRYAEKVPQDKIDWPPLDNGRSTISMCRELAMTPVWAMFAMKGPDKGWSEEKQQEQRKVMESWKTVDQCKAEFDNNFAEWDAFARALTDEQLSETKWLPYNGGRDHTYLEMLDYVRWNSTYHLGQIAYIQTLYGDKEVYW